MSTKWYERTLDTLRTAKKFVLDSTATDYLGQMVRRHPRVIADAQDFAIRPFERMWVEMPFPPYYKAFTGELPDATGDRTVGYLFDGPLVKVASHGWAPEMNRWVHAFVPVQYVLHKPMSPDEQAQVMKQTGLNGAGLDLWFWGESGEFFVHGRHTTEAAVEQLEDWEREVFGPCVKTIP